MPTYTYECKKCAITIDLFHGMNSKPRVKCPHCGSSCKRLLGTGAGIIFKGSGFYETDYREKSGTPTGTSDSKKESSSEKKETKSESKSESKNESKTDSKGSTTGKASKK